MRAVRLYGVGDLRVEDVPPPEAPAGDGVLLKVLAAGICGSDLHNFRTGQWISRTPSIPGHELAGEVLAVGPAVTKLAPGDRVVADSRFWCGACPACRRGERNLCERLGYVGEVCDGGFAERLVLPERLLLKVDPALDPAVAALAEPLAVALHAIARLRPAKGAPVLVLGCGPIGGLAALALARSGHGPILLVDRNAARLALLAEVTGGIPLVLERDAIRTATGGAPLRFAIEATGSTAALAQLLPVLSGGTAVALVGIPHGKPDLDLLAVVEREISLIGCSAFLDELSQAVGLLHAYAGDMRRLIEREIELAEAPEAYRRLLGGEAAGLKTIMRP
jgi:(R,R)-butanediol dehydrogenase/meso-butanediol dehydrogenase/diacetyl reductase